MPPFLFHLYDILDPDRIPSEVIEAAVADNPWFSERDIRQSVAGIRTWLNPETLETFFGSYSYPKAEPLTVGVVAAGNLPLVCMHDVLCVLGSGQRLVLKPSRQDQVLIRWVLNEWVAKSSLVEEIFFFDKKLPGADILIGTGSNNTARYLGSHYRGTPTLIRKNRYSVAVLGDWTTQTEMGYLLSDIFSYQGLGCRSVSSIVVLPGVSETLWSESLRNFPSDQLHPLYLERYLIELIRRGMVGENVIDSGTILRVPVQNLRYASMGVLHEITLPSMVAWEEMYQKHRDQIQCVVGVDLPYGKAQLPAIDDFADGVDTVAWILDQQNRCISGLESGQK